MSPNALQTRRVCYGLRFFKKRLEPVKHQEVDYCQADHLLAVARLIDVVFAQPPVASQPAEGALDDPATGQNDNAHPYRAENNMVVIAFDPNLCRYSS